MNWSHLRATLWLRWRILANRVRRAGKLSNVFFGVLLFLGLCTSVLLFVLGMAIGFELLTESEPRPLILWGVLAVTFLFSWMIGLLTDLQRSDAMSFKNLLHLPISFRWVFLYNYLSSFVSVSMAIFLPAMLGLWVAMVIVKGPWMVLTLPLVLGFFGMITALTYQLRGWLAHMMEDKRRGRNIIAAITVGFVLLLNVPNLINLTSRSSQREERKRERAEEHALRQAAGEEGPGQADAEARLALYLEREQQEDLELDRKISLGAMIIPIGWLPYGMRTSFEGRWLPGGLCTLGLLTITGLSLRRSYRTTLASIVGASSGEPKAELAGADTAPAPARGSVPSGARKTLLVQRTLPFVGEREAGIATMGLRSLLRAPEAKMMLLSPVIILGLFGLMLSKSSRQEALSAFAPVLSLGATLMGLLSIFQLIQNHFGLDRAGFRAFVLSPVPRHQILLGKNLATAPIGIGIGLVALIGLQFFLPTDSAHFIGATFQVVSAYMLLCMVGNMTSILAPMRLKEHGLKAANARWKAFLLQVLSLLLVPAALSPLLIPAGLDFFLPEQGWARAIPVYPVLHALGLIGIYLFYRWVLRRQGELLQSREQHILDVLTRD